MSATTTSSTDLETRAFQLLRTVFVIAPIAFGLDKFTNILTDWTIYLAPWINDIVPGTARAGHVRRRRHRDARRCPRRRRAAHRRLGRCRLAAGIIVNLLTIRDFYDVALRDFGLLVAAVALARLAVADAPAGRIGSGCMTAPDPTPVGRNVLPACASSGSAPRSTSRRRRWRSPRCSARWDAILRNHTSPTHRGGWPMPTRNC